MECKGSSPYERYEVTATYDTFTNANSKTIYGKYPLRLSPFSESIRYAYPGKYPLRLSLRLIVFL